MPTEKNNDLLERLYVYAGPQFEAALVEIAPPFYEAPLSDAIQALENTMRDELRGEMNLDEASAEKLLASLPEEGHDRLDALLGLAAAVAVLSANGFGALS